MIFGNAAESDTENVLQSLFSTEPEEEFFITKISGENSTGPGERTSVREALEGSESDRWKESLAEGLNGLWEKRTFRKGSSAKFTAWLERHALFPKASAR